MYKKRILIIYLIIIYLFIKKSHMRKYAILRNDIVNILFVYLKFRGLCYKCIEKKNVVHF